MSSITTGRKDGAKRSGKLTGIPAGDSPQGMALAPEEIAILAWGLDRPVKKMVEAHKRGEANALWPSHFYGRRKEYVQIEKPANLERLPESGFTVCAFPVKILGASGGWCRAVGIVNE